MVTGYGYEESTRIIRNVRSMSVHELLDLVVYNPFFITDAYYVEIGRAPEARDPVPAWVPGWREWEWQQVATTDALASTFLPPRYVSDVWERSNLHQQDGLEAARRNAIARSAQFSDQSIR